MERLENGALHVAGVPPAYIDGHWQEGYIVNTAMPTPTPPGTADTSFPP